MPEQWKVVAGELESLPHIEKGGGKWVCVDDAGVFIAQREAELRSEVERLKLIEVAAREFQRETKIWMHFLARDVGTDRIESTMESFPKVSDLSERLQALLEGRTDG